MQTLFLLCAIVGGGVLLIQFVMTLIGFGAHELGLDGLDAGSAADASHAADATDAAHLHDVGGAHDHVDHDSGALFKVISFRSLVAAIAFFGIAGMAATSANLDPFTSTGIAMLAGAGALYSVGWLFQSMHRMAEEGNMRIERAVGLPGTVYIPIPGAKSGAGKIQLKLQNRIVELRAVTSEKEKLPTGASVVVVDVINANTVAVERAREPVNV
jgi:membrane protein implicated in regulation of membrane protease activity